MERKIFIGSAWPYVNGPLHLGHVAGLLPADVLARYHRLCGDVVLWTSGSDCHGTPITERARQEGRSPREVAEEYHAMDVATFARLGFTYSLYWATMEPEHARHVQESFLELHRQGYIVEGDYQHALCATCGEARADREINGACPYCQNEARGDQCDSCGEMLNPNQLKDPACSKCQHPITFKVTRELFLDLPQFEAKLRTWVAGQSHWRTNAKTWTEGWLKDGLKPRAITRGIDWGIPVPLPGWEDRRIYVWFEAVHGYWSASIQWAENSGHPDAWKAFWTDPDVIAYYVIGKDNIPFHSIIWPAILMARGYVLPWHIVSSEYLVFDDRKLSKSKGWVLWADDILNRYDPDFIRYFLLAQGPEAGDTNFTWERFVDVTNHELIHNWGNLVQRTVGFAKKCLGGTVPALGELGERDHAILDLVKQSFANVAVLIEETQLRRACEEIMSLVREANRYFNDCAPWVQIKTNEARASTTIAVVLQVIASVGILFEPFLPFQAERLRSIVPCTRSDPAWHSPILTVGGKFGEAGSFFQMIDPEIVEKERERLEAQLKKA